MKKALSAEGLKAFHPALEISSALAYNYSMPRSSKLGQNFLHDKNIAVKIINVFLPQPGPVLEIGAGPGILSGLLLEKIPPGRLTLVEVDHFLAQRLRERFGAEPRILEKNILDVALATIFPVGPVGVIGNLPYHISKALIDWFIAQRAMIGQAVLMLQKDFIDKLLSDSGKKKYNAQSVAFQTLFQVRRCFNVPAGAFVPAPKVISTVLAVRPANSPLQAQGDEFYHFVRLCFSKRRKTLSNNLSPYFDKNIMDAAFAICGLTEKTRAEQLPAERFLPFFTVLNGTAAVPQK